MPLDHNHRGLLVVFRVQCSLSHYIVQGVVLLTVGRSYVGNDVTHSTVLLLDRTGACSYENLPKYRSYRVSNTAPKHTTVCIIHACVLYYVDADLWGPFC